MVEPPVSYLEATVLAAACEMAMVFGSTGCAFLARRVPISPTTLSLLRYFLRTTTRHGKTEDYGGRAERSHQSQWLSERCIPR